VVDLDEVAGAVDGVGQLGGAAPQVAELVA
jgi:hypothetical protein